MKARLQMTLSMAIFGTIAIFVRNVPTSSAMVALMRAVIATLCLLLYRLLLRKPIRLKEMGRDLPALFFSGAAMGFNWILLFEAYRYTTVSIATLSYYFAPMLVTAVSAAFFGERLTRRQALCFAGATVGLVLVIGLNNLGGGASAKGVLFGLGAAALYATVVLFNKRIRSVGGVDRTLLQFIAAIVVLTPYLLVTGDLRLDGMTAAGWVNLLIVGILHTGVTYVMYFSSLRNLRGQEAAILSYIDPLVAVVISFTLLHEPIAPLQLIGGAMILLFTLAN